MRVKLWGLNGLARLRGHTFPRISGSDSGGCYLWSRVRASRAESVSELGKTVCSCSALWLSELCAQCLMQRSCIWGLKTLIWIFALLTTYINCHLICLASLILTFLVCKNGTSGAYFWLMWKIIEITQCVLNNTWHVVDFQLFSFFLPLLFPVGADYKIKLRTVEIYLKHVVSLLRFLGHTSFIAQSCGSDRSHPSYPRQRNCSHRRLKIPNH